MLLGSHVVEDQGVACKPWKYLLTNASIHIFQALRNWSLCKMRTRASLCMARSMEFVDRPYLHLLKVLGGLQSLQASTGSVINNTVKHHMVVVLGLLHFRDTNDQARVEVQQHKPPIVPALRATNFGCASKQRHAVFSRPSMHSLDCLLLTARQAVLVPPFTIILQ